MGALAVCVKDYESCGVSRAFWQCIHDGAAAVDAQ